MVQDQIEREIVIAAPLERVWAVLTESEHVGKWFGQGEPTPVDLRPGGSMTFDHGKHGIHPAKIVNVEPPRFLAYRWASGHAGQEPVEGNSTLVEFTLTPEGEGTRLRVVETGFSCLTGSEEWRQDRFNDNAGGWPGAVGSLQQYAEKLVA
jgi:uncharacterized protein YndB with AHSA1/START domain